MFGKICRNGNMLTLDVQNPPKFEVKLYLDSIGSSLGIDRELIWAGLDWRGPDIRQGLYIRQLIIEGHRGIRR